MPVELKLPPDLPEGSYTATVCDDLAATRGRLRDNPLLSNPQNLEQLFESLRVQAATRRTHLVVRVPLPAVGVAVEGKSLPNLPPSMVQMLGSNRRAGSQTMSGALVSRRETEWVVQGSESVKFNVVKDKKVGLKSAVSVQPDTLPTRVFPSSHSGVIHGLDPSASPCVLARPLFFLLCSRREGQGLEPARPVAL